MVEFKDFSFIHKYFIGEKQESLLFLAVGIIAILLSVVFFFFMKTNPSFFKGAAIPLLLVGIIQTGVGYTVYERSDKQRMDIAYNIGVAPIEYTKNQELPRMETVMRKFIVYRWAEIALAFAGIVLSFLFRQDTDRVFWYGLGITLAIQAILMLGADYLAEKRGKNYTSELKSIINS